MSTSSPSEGRRPTRTRAPAARASAAWRANEPGPNAGAITVGGASSSAFVPEPWRSGTITTPGSGRCRAARRPRPGRAPGSRPARAARARRRARPRRGRRARRPPTGPPRRGRARPRRPARAPCPPARSSADTTITPSSPRTAPSASSTSRHRLGQRAPLGAATASPSRCLARPKDLMGRTASGAHARPRRYPRRAAANDQRLERDAPAGVGVGHLDVGLERRHAARALVADQPVDQPRVVRARSRRPTAGAPPTP